MTVFRFRALLLTLLAAVLPLTTSAVPDLGIGASLNGARPFPSNNAWNMDISRFPVHPNSANLIASIGTNTGLHPDFGTFWQGSPIGIPYVVVAGSQPQVPINFIWYPGESDAGPYPIPPNAPVEGGPASTGDRHVLTIDRDNWKLYETYYSFPINGGASWDAGSGAVWNFNSNKLRPLGWTSADAAGLPIFPGLVRRDEVILGEIKHAIRFTAQTTRTSFVYPATHHAGSTSSQNAPPMGMRVRLKSTFNINSPNFSPNVRVILRAMQKYGMILADNGSNWYVTGTHDPLWNDDELSSMSRVKGSDFEVVQTPGRLLMPHSDFDGDGKTDISVFRPSTGAWYLQQSQAGFFGTQFGLSTDKIAPADYDGDGRTDIAVYRPSNGVWYKLDSSTNTVSYSVFGISEDLPTPADYDADGRADISVFRPSTGTWYRQNSSNNSFFGLKFGLSEDKPTVGDFDGDGKSDIAVFRPSTGVWYRINSSTNSFFGEQFGLSIDQTVPADYDGDGKTDLAVFRPSNGFWYIKNSANSTYSFVPFGLSEDIPTPGDFDADGKADLSVFRPSTGTWYRQNTWDNSFAGLQFGTTEDRPTQVAFRY
ncbi:MAG: FG-GAP repeat domain-containing protein [Pyrinomonadaceae bacterium]